MSPVAADDSFFKRYRRDALRSPVLPARTIEQKRQTVVKAIDAWIAVLNGGPPKGVMRLSKVREGERLVWLKYGNENVPLTEEGDLTGVIDLDQDEVAFWQWAKDQVLGGAYDNGILFVSDIITKRLGKSWRRNLS